MPEPEVLVARKGRLGQITLNRPAAMNALNHSMVKQVATALDEFEQDQSVATVLISGAGDRGLCAGGDIVALFHDAKAGGEASIDFWRDEYALNARIHKYPKPIVTIMDGVVLGGGVGISAHASHRVVTERSKIGMPETAIGFVPDVGGLYLLANAPGQVGTHAALTGQPFSGADAIMMGFADHFVESQKLPQLVAALSEREVGAGVALYGQVPPAAPLAGKRDWIDTCYVGGSVGAILERLRNSSSEIAQAAAESIASRSPLALSVTLAALRKATVAKSLREVLAQDLRVSARALRWPDFAEGIRAQVIEKDRNPQWQPAGLAEVTKESIDAAFASLGSQELTFPDVPERTKP